MLSRWWTIARVHIETLRQYRSAMVTAEALVWHHGYKGLDAALKAAEAPTGDLREGTRRPVGRGSLHVLQAGGFRAARGSARAMEAAQGPDDLHLRPARRNASNRRCTRKLSPAPGFSETSQSRSSLAITSVAR
jgi:hypothetical protein